MHALGKPNKHNMTRIVIREHKTEEGTKIHEPAPGRARKAKGERALGRGGGVAFVGTLALVEVLAVEVEHDLGAALHDEHLGQHLGRCRG